MSSQKLRRPKHRPTLRLQPEDPDHHLVLNRSFWWVCCSINDTPRTKEKLGYSLRTKCLLTARLRRDIFLHGLQAEGLEVRLRRSSSVALTALRQVPPARLALSWKERVADVLATALSTDLPQRKERTARSPLKKSPVSKVRARPRRQRAHRP